MTVYRASKRARNIELTVWGVLYFLFTFLTAFGGGLFGLVFGFPFVAFAVVYILVSYSSFEMKIDDNMVEVSWTFIGRNRKTLEFDKIEGVTIAQGPFGRSKDFGKLTISGTGSKAIQTLKIDNPEQVAERIRDLIRKPAVGNSGSVSQAGVGQDMKRCPYCAEDIKIEAIKCRYCGESLSV